MTSRSDQNRLPERVVSRLPVKRLSRAIERPSQSRLVAIAAPRFMRRNDSRNRRGQDTLRTNRYTRNATIAAAVTPLKADWISAAGHRPHGGAVGDAVAVIDRARIEYTSGALTPRRH